MSKKIAVLPKPQPATDPLGKLRESLTGPRLTPKGTIISYEATARRFLAMLGNNQVPTRAEYNYYFDQRRKLDISERTLAKEFFHLKALAGANGWPWLFTKRDRPQAEEEPEHHFLSIQDIEQLIRAQANYTKAERFYLAVATTWVVRRSELAKIKKRDFDTELFTIHTVKHGRKVKALIPDVLKPIFQSYAPKELTPDSLSATFRRICTKAGLKVPRRTGWHMIRYAVNTVLNAVLPKHGLHPGILSTYCGWARNSRADLYGGAAMMGYYHRPEILDSDPYGVFKVIYGIHPFLKVWKQALSRKRAPMKSSLPAKSS